MDETNQSSTETKLKRISDKDSEEEKTERKGGIEDDNTFERAKF